MLSDTLRYFAFGRYWIRFMFNMSMRYHAHCTNLAETFMISQVWLEENDLWLESSLLVTIDILLNYPSWTNNNVWKSFFSLQMFLFQVSLIQTVYSNRLLFFLITLWDLEKAYCFSEWNLMCCSAVLKNWRSPPETTTNQFQVVKNCEENWILTTSD